MEDEYFVYRLTKNRRRVERKALIDYGYQFSIPMERYDAKDLRKVWRREEKSHITGNMER